MKKPKRKIVLKPTSFSKRVFAYIIDSIVLSFVVVYPLVNLNPERFTIEAMLIGSLVAILMLMYWSILEFMIHQTIGKMFLGLYVRSTSGKLKLSQTIIRNLTKISTLTLALDCLPFLKKRHQRYFERLSATEVVEPTIR